MEAEAEFEFALEEMRDRREALTRSGQNVFLFFYFLSFLFSANWGGRIRELHYARRGRDMGIPVKAATVA